MRKNELSFIDLLRPFASVDTSSVAINTTREQPYRVPRMNLHFCESGEVAQPPEEFVDIVLDGVVRASAADARSKVSEVDGKEAAARLVQRDARRSHGAMSRRAHWQRAQGARGGVVVRGRRLRTHRRALARKSRGRAGCEHRGL